MDVSAGFTLKSEDFKLTHFPKTISFKRQLRTLLVLLLIFGFWLLHACTVRMV